MVERDAGGVLQFGVAGGGVGQAFADGRRAAVGRLAVVVVAGAAQHLRQHLQRDGQVAADFGPLGEVSVEPGEHFHRPPRRRRRVFVPVLLGQQQGEIDLGVPVFVPVERNRRKIRRQPAVVAAGLGEQVGGLRQPAGGFAQHGQVVAYRAGELAKAQVPPDLPDNLRVGEDLLRPFERRQRLRRLADALQQRPLLLNVKTKSTAYFGSAGNSRIELLPDFRGAPVGRRGAVGPAQRPQADAVVVAGDCQVAAEVGPVLVGGGEGLQQRGPGPVFVRRRRPARVRSSGRPS